MTDSVKLIKVRESIQADNDRQAQDLRKELKARNADRPEDRRMELRIGVNLGDVRPLRRGARSLCGHASPGPGTHGARS